MLGREVPVTPARAEMFVTEPLPLMKHGGFHGVELYGRQTLRGNLVYGGGPHEWLDANDPGLDRPTTPLVLQHGRAGWPRCCRRRRMRG